ncbi:cullin 5 isoform X3 [Nomia melanderi]|uniref:cullin 5 isoform X3 n=1 Tax=Nomia melanderi TaxID=2448451 RepID=UPI003FCE6CD7
MATMLKDKGRLMFEDKWPFMRSIILKLLVQEPVTPAEWQDLFYSVHLVCVWDDNGPPKLRDALKEDIMDFIKQAQQRILAHQEEQALLKAYIVEWRKFFIQCIYFPTPFRQLETSLVGKTSSSTQKRNQPDDVVRKLMLDSWNQSIFGEIKQKLQDSAMRLIRAERNGEAFDSQLVIGVRESYVNLCSNTTDQLQIYRENFEAAYIETTEAFYWVKAPEQLSLHGVENYMRYAEAKLREEELRAQKYLEPNSASVQLLTDCCVRMLVASFKPAILAECPRMIQHHQTDQLRLMLKLMDRVSEGVGPMLRNLEEHIASAGLADMMAAVDVITHDSEKYVERLLDLFRRFSTLVKEAFDDDPRFLTARDKAYKLVVNDATVFKLELPARQSSGIGTSILNNKPNNNNNKQPESKCPELLANYCDMLLRKTPLSKKLTSDEIENTSADSEKEENMVEWLREVGMPADYVNKLARMFQDIKVSQDLNQQFKEQCRAAIADSINIKILNAGAWARGSERVTVSLPLQLEDYIPEVEEFYKKKHSGRKLQWYHHMSNGTITFSNQVGRFDVDVTTFQMAVLFAWNQRPFEKITYENLRLATELPDPELRRTLWSLCVFPKLKRQLLLVEPPAHSPKDFANDTRFWVNQEFAIVKNGKLQKRGKINLIGRLQLSTERSKEEDNQSIVQLRILRVQEAIIKILKMRKKISNAQLQTELVDILKNMFLPSKKMIKEQIEWLIEHKYIRRHDDDINTFVYVA